MKILKTSSLIIFILSFLFILFPASFSSEEIRFVVSLEEKQDSVIQGLSKENLIRNPSLFRLLVSVMKIPAEIEPGAYKLKRNLWLPVLANTLLYHPYQKWVLLRPGLRKEQVAEIISDTFSWNKQTEKEFIDSAEEGYLFPDTYLFETNQSPDYFIAKMKNNFNEKFDAQLQSDLLARDVRNDTAVKIASLIERESGSDSDKALIAGIIWNRLLKDMRLQIDAATQYILGTPGNWWPRVKPADHKTESPYNTYLNKGLPPLPISNPSLSSIRSAVYPQETDCLYYIHDKNKQIHCSKTYEEHLENINIYLK